MISCLVKFCKVSLVIQMFRSKFLLLLLYHSKICNLTGDSGHHGEKVSVQENLGGKGARKERLFNVLNIVKFPNDACESSDSANKFGVCYSASECSAAGIVIIDTNI